MKQLALALMLLPLCALAQDQRLSAVRDTVLGMRRYASEHPQVRGAIPAVTTAKHQLLDWIEARLATFPENGDVAALNESLHEGIRDAKLFCDNDVDCLPTSLGFLDEIQIMRQRQFLILETAVGIGFRCGYDYSAYIYQWTGRWRRIWENEQDDYSPKTYLPQLLHSVQISDPESDGSRLILTLGTRSACVTFREVYYRVWRLGDPKPLLDRSEILDDEGDPPVIGKLQPDEVRIQFSAGGLAYGYPHKAVRRFEIHGTAVNQTDPIAPTPRDFVEEWLAAPWSQSIAQAESPALEQWHEKLHRDDNQGDFPDEPVHCTVDPELWQIATHLEGEPRHYFLVRRHRPERFTMVQIGEQPLGGCT